MLSLNRITIFRKCFSKSGTLLSAILQKCEKMTLITTNTKYFEIYYLKKIRSIDQYCDYVIKIFSVSKNYQNIRVCISNKNYVLISRRIGNYNTVMCTKCDIKRH